MLRVKSAKYAGRLVKGEVSHNTATVARPMMEMLDMLTRWMPDPKVVSVLVFGSSQKMPRGIVGDILVSHLLRNIPMKLC